METMIYVKHPNPLKEPDYIFIENRPELILNQEYLVDSLFKGYRMAFTKDNHYLGKYPEQCFKTLKQLRKKKLKALK